MFEENPDYPTDFDRTEAFYKFIGVDNPNFYRKNMHLLNPPFNIQDKLGFRHLPKDHGKYRFIVISFNMDFKFKSVKGSRKNRYKIKGGT